MSTVLRLEGVSKSFGGVRAVDDVSFSVAAGECVALLGGNGAGKSTIVSMISGIAQPDSGSIVFNGARMTFNGPADARRAGIETVFQNLGLCENLDAPSNFFLGRELYSRQLGLRLLRKREMRHRTADALRDIGVRMPPLNAPVVKLSGGQRQALAFARAVRGASGLLILDEPTAALGVAEKEQIIQVVRGLVVDKGMSVLLISHDMDEMQRLADRVVVLRRGRIAAQEMPAVSDLPAIVSLITGAHS
jgi:ABC-type sugar transport system ATPase subunit